MEEKIRMPRKPSLPKEQVIHYIVKDYRRMFTEFDALRERAEKAEAENEKLKEKNRIIRGDLLKQNEKKKADMQQYKDKVLKDAANMREDYEMLNARLNDQIRKNKLLVQALAEPESVTSVLASLDEPFVVNTKDGKDRLDKALRELEAVKLRLNSVEMRLWNVEKVVEEHCSEEVVKAYLKRFNAAFGKIDSVMFRIDNFLALMKNVRTE